MRDTEKLRYERMTMTKSKNAARQAAKKPSRRSQLKKATAKRAMPSVLVIPCGPLSRTRTALSQRGESVLKRMPANGRLLITMSRLQADCSRCSCSGHRLGSSCVSKRFWPTPCVRLPPGGSAAPNVCRCRSSPPLCAARLWLLRLTRLRAVRHAGRPQNVRQAYGPF